MMVKTRNNSACKQSSAIIIMLVVCLLVGILPSVSALDLQAVSLEKVGVDWDNVESFTKTIDTSIYGKYEIRNSILSIPFLSLSKVADIELKDNSDVCGVNCFADKEITLYNDGVLIDDIIFKTEQEDGSWIEQDIRNYQFSYQGEIQDYKTVCVDDKELTLNGTMSQTCEQVTDGTQIGTINYKMGEVVKAGTYDLRLDGQKKPSRTVDWIVKTNGIWTDEWAVWGNISEGDDAEVVLNSPTDNAIAYNNPVTFSASANVSGGATLTNMTLYNNISGSWIANGTTNITESLLNLINYFKLDEVTGTTAYDTMGRNNLTELNGLIIGQEGKINYSYNSTATSAPENYLSIGITDVSIMMWIYLKSSGEKGGFLKFGSGEDGFGLGVGSNNWDTNGNELIAYFGGVRWIDSNTNIGTGWHQVAMTLDSSSVPRLYLDGSELGSYSGTSPISYNWMGLFGYSTRNLTAGNKLDEVTIWDKILTEEEINYYYNSDTGRSPLSITTSSTQTWSRTITGTTLWNVKACDSDGDCGFAPANFTVFLDSQAPTINITSGNETQSYGSLSQNHTINYTITDSNLNSCWIGYNGTNNSIDCVSGESNSTSFALVKNLYNATIYANDSVGNINSTFIEWDYIFFEETSTFEGIVYETDSKTFEINITTGLTILTQSGNLIYNDTTYSASSSCSSGVCTFSKVIDIPLITSGESQNRSFYWALTLFDGSTSYDLNTSESIQNTTRIHLEECGGIYTTPTVNFTAYYETNLTRINPFYIAGTFDTWLGSGEVYRTSSFNKASTADLKLCITPTDKSQYSNAHIEYKFDNENVTFIPRNYFFQNKSLTNVSEEINLFLLEAEDSTSFIIKVQDQKLSPVAEALVYIQKYYPSDGTYRTVQIARTDSNGETLGFYETETTDYKHTIIKNGVTLLETASQKVVGKSVPYTLTFTIGQALGYPWTSFEDNLNVSTNLTFDKDTNIVTFNYIENTTGYVTSGQLLVFQNSLTNSTTTIICNVTSTEASASLTCDLSDYDGTFTAVAYVNGESQNIIEFIITNARKVFGNDGLFLGMMIILTAGFAMMWNPSAGIISINAAVIFVNIIGFISVSPVFIFGMIGISIITIILLKT